MNKLTRIAAQLLAGSAALILLFPASKAFADTTQSFTGMLATSEATFETTVTLTSASDVTLQTFGFGGGTNAQGTAIAPGGTDPFVAIFSGTGSGASILTDASSNPFGTSLDLGNYSSFVGCGPANTVSDFGDTTCGDVTMTLDSLAVGTYTIVLSDGQYIANAVFDNGTLGEGFTDFTGGVFCNAVDTATGTACPNTSGVYALDVTVSSQLAPTPEPGTLVLLVAAMTALASRKSRLSGERTVTVGRL